MMLQELLEYASQEQLAAQPGLKSKTVRWLLVFSSQGELLGVQDLRAGDDRRGRGREFPGCPDLTQQEMVAIGGGCRHFLVDSLDVVALLTKSGEVDAKLSAKHDFFVSLLDQADEVLPQLGLIASALREPATLEAIRQQLTEAGAKPTELATLAAADAAGSSTVFVERDDWHAWWQACRLRLTEKRRSKPTRTRRGAKSGSAAASAMRCLASGELVEPLPTHNKVEGLSDVGGLSMGDALTSFDKDAFGSYGLQQGANAAMSEGAVKTYVTALNQLIRNRGRRLAGTKVVYWYSGAVEPEDDVVLDLFGDYTLQPAGDEPGSDAGSGDRPATDLRERSRAENHARQLLEAIREGRRPGLLDARYYALSLSANSGRVVIRDWMEGSFEELVGAVNRWFDDLAIVSRDGSRVIAAHKFAAVLAAAVRDLKDIPPPLVAAMWRSAIQQRPIPHEVMAQTLLRVRMDLVRDQPASHARFALMKAFLNRKKGLAEMAPQLNEHETHPAYLCGRIMAILARIQRAALGDVGAGIVQRYYAAASTTPALVLGRLIRNAQIGHLPKIDGGLRVWFEKQLTAVWQKLQRAPPAVLTLEEQTLFAMGYYQENARAYRTEDADERRETTAPDPEAALPSDQ